MPHGASYKNLSFVYDMIVSMCLTSTCPPPPPPEVEALVVAAGTNDRLNPSLVWSCPRLTKLLIHCTVHDMRSQATTFGLSRVGKVKPRTFRGADEDKRRRERSFVRGKKLVTRKSGITCVYFGEYPLRAEVCLVVAGENRSK